MVDVDAELAGDAVDGDLDVGVAQAAEHGLAGLEAGAGLDLLGQAGADAGQQIGRSFDGAADSIRSAAAEVDVFNTRQRNAAVTAASQKSDQDRQAINRTSADNTAPPGDAGATYSLNRTARDCAIQFVRIF